MCLAKPGKFLKLRTCVESRFRLSKRSGLDISGASKRGDDDTARRSLAYKQLEVGRNRSLAKEALAAADGDRKYFEPQFIDQIVFQKRLDEIAAAVNLQFGAAGRLQDMTSCGAR